jgi:hypothetical protein
MTYQLCFCGLFYNIIGIVDYATSVLMWWMNGGLEMIWEEIVAA